MTASAVHDPGRIVCDPVIALALGGDCLADIAVLRAEPGLFGRAASDPTVSRLVDTLARDCDKALAAVAAARAGVRAAAWEAAGGHAPDHGIGPDKPLIVDLDATLVTAHSEKQNAAPTFKRGFGFHPLCSFVDHGARGTGEPLSIMLRLGNAGSNTAADHIAVTWEALRQLSFTAKGGRADTRCSSAPTPPAAPKSSWTGYRLRRLELFAGVRSGSRRGRPPRPDPEGRVDSDLRRQKHPPWVAEATGVLDLSSRPKGMRVIVRKERPHPGRPLRFTDADGLRPTAFATNTPRGQLPDLELRHRRRAGAEDRIRTAKATGLTNPPLHGYAHNRIRIAIVAPAVELTA